MSVPRKARRARLGSSGATSSTRTDLVAFLVDTNVLVYGFGAGDVARGDRARACLRRLGDARNGAVSAQVLGEFFTAITRRAPAPLSRSEAEAVVVNLSRAWPVYSLTGMAVLEATRAIQQYQL